MGTPGVYSDGSLWPGRFVSIGLYDTYEVLGNLDGCVVHDVLDDKKFTVGFGVMWMVGDGLPVEPGLERNDFFIGIRN